MSFVSINFISFTILSLLAYYVLPKNIRWISLLISSYIFYLTGGHKTVIYLIFTTITAYTAGIVLGNLNTKFKVAKQEKNEELQKNIKNKKRMAVTLTCIANFSVLFFFKYWNFTAEIFNSIVKQSVFPVFDLILPLAISFYMFQAIGYIIDVYRNKYKPEKNIFKFALFVSFFPQMVQGPISRFDKLGKSLSDGNDFSFDNLKAGIELTIWGYLKKLIIADRASVIVKNIFDNYQTYDGLIIILGVVFYCIQLYCDFSGGIDITRGIAKMFGIDLIDNFKRPIFSTSLAEFWRRWHISLGTWMKDYLFYPLSLSKPFIKLGKIVRKHIGGKAGKILPVSIVTFIVYVVIGIWHGASFKYIAFGFWNGTIITISLLLENVFAKIKSKLGINDTNPFYKLFMILRTCFIVLIGRYITRANGFRIALDMLKRSVTAFSLDGIKNGILLNMGLKFNDFVIIFIGVLVMLIIECFLEKNIDIRDKLQKKSFVFQLIVMIISILVLIFFGIFRGEYISSEFIYKQF